MKVFDIYPRNKEVARRSGEEVPRRDLAAARLRTGSGRVTLRELRPPDQVKTGVRQRAGGRRRRWPSCASAPTASARRRSSKPPAKSAFKLGRRHREVVDREGRRQHGGDAEDRKGNVEDLPDRPADRFRTMLAEAQAYRIHVVESAKGDRSTMESLLKNPAQIKVFLDHARVDALQEVLNACYEKYYYNAAADKTHRLLELWLNRRPELIRAQTKPHRVSLNREERTFMSTTASRAHLARGAPPEFRTGTAAGGALADRVVPRRRADHQLVHRRARYSPTRERSRTFRRSSARCSWPCRSWSGRSPTSSTASAT